MAQSAPTIRPLGVGDLFDEAIRLYRRNFLLFLGIGAVVLVPAVVVQFAPTVLTLTMDPSDDLPVVIGVVYFVVALLMLVGYAAMFGAITYAVSEAYLGRQTSLGAAYQWALPRLLSLIGLWIVYFLAIMLLLITIVGWIYVAILWGFAFHAHLIEGTGIRQALGRSRALVRGSWWRVFGITLLFSLFASVLSWVFYLVGLIPAGIIVAIDPSGAAGEIAIVIALLFGALAQVFLVPLTYCAWTLLYYDLRVRKEGFDLELLASAIDRSPGAASYRAPR